MTEDFKWIQDIELYDIHLMDAKEFVNIKFKFVKKGVVYGFKYKDDSIPQEIRKHFMDGHVLLVYDVSKPLGERNGCWYTHKEVKEYLTNSWKITQ